MFHRTIAADCWIARVVVAFAAVVGRDAVEPSDAAHPRKRLDSVSPYQNSRTRSAVRLIPVDWIQHLQWPAMAATLLSAWLVAEQSKGRRKWGFWIFILSNVLWVAWGWKAHAYALIILQFGLAILNIRGVAKNERG